MSNAKPPKHPFHLEIHVGGETWEHVVREAERLVYHVADHGVECNMASGGVGTASHVHVQTRDVSPEQYREELAEWFDNHKAVKRTEAPPTPGEVERDG